MEHRRFSRVECRAEALIKYKDISFLGEVENLSLKGLFVRTDQRIEVGEPVEVSVFFYGSSANLSFSLRGTVVRESDEGIGINFRKIDIGSVAHTATCDEIDVPEDCSVLSEFRGFVQSGASGITT